MKLKLRKFMTVAALASISALYFLTVSAVSRIHTGAMGYANGVSADKRVHKPNDPINTSKVIIYAKYRTRSTSASRFFFENHNVSYIFEPLRFEPAIGQPSAHLSNGVLWEYGGL